MLTFPPLNEQSREQRQSFVKHLQFVRLVRDSPRMKQCILLFHVIGDSYDTNDLSMQAPVGVLVMAEKTAWSNEREWSQLFQGRLSLPLDDRDDVSDIYARFTAQLSNQWASTETNLPIADVHLTVIYPATRQHLLKYEEQSLHIVRETPSLYKNIVAPYVESVPRERTNWIHSILCGESEQHSLLFNDPHPEQGFVLLPDSKWDQRTIQGMYLLALVRDASLKSIRDLRAKHLPLLRHLRDTILDTVHQNSWAEGVVVPKDAVRLFFHYPPSYYHLHIHVTHVHLEPSFAMTAGQSHLLEDVIDCLENDGEFFEWRTLTFCLGESHPLFGLITMTTPDK